MRYAFANLIGSVLALAACKKPDPKSGAGGGGGGAGAGAAGAKRRESAGSVLFGSKPAYTVNSVEDALGHIERAFVKCNNAAVRAGSDASPLPLHLTCVRRTTHEHER